MKYFLLFSLLFLSGCANLTDKEQRIVSGAAIGGFLGPPGVLVGGLTGLVIHSVQ